MQVWRRGYFASNGCFARAAREGACVPSAKAHTQVRVNIQNMPKHFKNRLVIPKAEAKGGWHSRGYLPHFDGESVTQHVSFHLADSMPKTVLDSWSQELKHL